jgi:hypothetical protein
MRIPAFLVDHPGEAFIAAVLLIALVFGSADRHAAEVARTASQHGAKLATSDR